MDNLPVLKYQENIQVVPDVSIPETLSSTKPVIFYVGRKITPIEALNIHLRLSSDKNSALNVLKNSWLDILEQIVKKHPHLLRVEAQQNLPSSNSESPSTSLSQTASGNFSVVPTLRTGNRSSS